MASGGDEPRLTHLDEAGRARMVDVSAKPPTDRRAVAEGFVRMSPATFAAFVEGRLPKGDATAVARLAAIMGAKRTSDLIPLCHPIPLTGIDVQLEPLPPDRLRIVATVATTAPTGVEMEALTAVAVGALAVYDMCKALDRGIVIESVRLLEKRGGKSGDWRAEEP